MQRMRMVPLLLIIATCLAACGAGKKSEAQFAGGTFYCKAFVRVSSWEPIEYYSFDEDGFGTVKGKTYEHEFSWSIEDGMINTSIPILNGSNFRYVDGCLIDPAKVYEGNVPDGETFEATVEKETGRDSIIRLIFKKDGTVERSYTQEGTESVSTVTYVREGNLITVDDRNDYFVDESKLYANPLRLWMEDG